MEESIDGNIGRIEQIFGQSNDLVIRPFCYEAHRECRAALIYIDGLISVRRVGMKLQ